MREKQIEEMDTVIRSLFGCQFAYKINFAKYGGFDYHEAVFTKYIAEHLYNAGYRKDSEVAREIFGEIEKCRVIGVYGIEGYLIEDIAELKKKFTEEEG